MRHAVVVMGLALAGCCCRRMPLPCVSSQPIVQPVNVHLTPSASDACVDLRHVVPFILGKNDLLPGDVVTILEVRSDRLRLEVGGHYCVRGTYILESKPRATLCLWNTNGDTEGESSLRCKSVARGRGEFVFRFNSVEGRFGDPHVSFYGDADGEGFGGVYFDNPSSH
jgi:hypothetical protein